MRYLRGKERQVFLKSRNRFPGREAFVISEATIGNERQKYKLLCSEEIILVSAASPLANRKFTQEVDRSSLSRIL